MANNSAEECTVKGSLIIITCFVLGIIVGLCQLLPANISGSVLSFSALLVLMFCVGVTIGNDSSMLNRFRHLDARLMLLPLCTILGTLGGVVAVAWLLPERQLTSCLAIGSGFGYYSLSSIFITEMRGAELGTIALLANLMREMITLLGAPLLARYFGPLAPISVAGATSMDTTLPIITQTSGKEYTVIAIFHGFVTDFSVPFLVTFFCSI